MLRIIHFAHLSHCFGFVSALPMAVPATFVASWIASAASLWILVLWFSIPAALPSMLCLSPSLDVALSFWILVCISCVVAVATGASAACTLICMFDASDSQSDECLCLLTWRMHSLVKHHHHLGLRSALGEKKTLFLHRYLFVILVCWFRPQK